MWLDLQLRTECEALQINGGKLKLLNIKELYRMKQIKIVAKEEKNDITILKREA